MIATECMESVGYQCRDLCQRLGSSWDTWTSYVDGFRHARGRAANQFEVVTFQRLHRPYVARHRLTVDDHQGDVGLGCIDEAAIRRGWNIGICGNDGW